MRIFLDASFLVYLNIDVAEAEKIDELFRILLKEDLYIDVLVLNEVIKSLLAKPRLSKRSCWR